MSVASQRNFVGHSKLFPVMLPLPNRFLEVSIWNYIQTQFSRHNNNNKKLKNITQKPEYWRKRLFFKLLAYFLLSSWTLSYIELFPKLNLPLKESSAHD